MGNSDTDPCKWIRIRIRIRIRVPVAQLRRLVRLVLPFLVVRPEDAIRPRDLLAPSCCCYCYCFRSTTLFRTVLRLYHVVAQGSIPARIEPYTPARTTDKPNSHRWYIRHVRILCINVGVIPGDLCFCWCGRCREANESVNFRCVRIHGSVVPIEHQRYSSARE